MCVISRFFEGSKMWWMVPLMEVSDVCVPQPTLVPCFEVSGILSASDALCDSTLYRQQQQYLENLTSYQLLCSSCI